MADIVTGDTEKLEGVIGLAQSLISEVEKSKSELESAISNINSQVGVGTLVDPIPTSVCDNFDTSSIVQIHASLIAQKSELEDYDRAHSDGKGNILGNLFGGLTQGFVGVAEGFIDTAAGVLGATAGFIGCNGFESEMRKFVDRDLAYETAYKVGNKISGGKGYDENSKAAAGGRFVGTTASYVALGYVCGTSMAADAALGAVSGFGKGMQQGVRSGNTLTGSLKYAMTSAVKEAGLSMASNYIFSKVGKSISNGVSKFKNGRAARAGARESAEAAARTGARESAETAARSEIGRAHV